MLAPLPQPIPPPPIASICFATGTVCAFWVCVVVSVGCAVTNNYGIVLRRPFRSDPEQPRGLDRIVPLAGPSHRPSPPPLCHTTGPAVVLQPVSGGFGLTRPPSGTPARTRPARLSFARIGSLTETGDSCLRSVRRCCLVSTPRRLVSVSVSSRPAKHRRLSFVPPPTPRLVRCVPFLSRALSLVEYQNQILASVVGFVAGNVQTYLRCFHHRQCCYPLLLQVVQPVRNLCV
mmetsp:Transcript_19497/g.40175  ORF Transcript_19497/g.40175 Transcript_19497/m.40175 type:complete len:232 (+) Transcript_19497:228-923(+)